MYGCILVHVRWEELYLELSADTWGPLLLVQVKQRLGGAVMKTNNELQWARIQQVLHNTCMDPEQWIRPRAMDTTTMPKLSHKTDSPSTETELYKCKKTMSNVTLPLESAACVWCFCSSCKGGIVKLSVWWDGALVVSVLLWVMHWRGGLNEALEAEWIREEENDKEMRTENDGSSLLSWRQMWYLVASVKKKAFL